MNDLEFHGTTVYDPAVFADLVNIIERGDARPVVGAVYALEQIHEAQHAFQQKQHVGAMVLTI